MYKQFNTFGLKHRMELKISQYFSRLIRTPQSGIMYDQIKYEHWNMINQHCKYKQEQGSKYKTNNWWNKIKSNKTYRPY